MNIDELWVRALACDVSDDGRLKMVKAIRLEAWKQGMTDAAEICVCLIDNMEPRLAESCRALRDAIRRSADSKAEL